MAKARIEPPYFPIIFVRGYAGTEAIVENTVATPYMGFNQGATKVRQRWTGAVVRHVFESPLVRLMKDYGYLDAYRDGAEARSAPPRSIFIYRYYDEVEETGERREIEAYAASLGDTILRVRDLVCGDDAEARQAFRVHLVAHSMGGLICRTLVQNPHVSPDEAKGLVDKVFTYGTPHNGLDFAVLGNVPGFFSLNNADNFNRVRMGEYLDLPGDPPRVDTLNDRFDPGRFFCLAGTNDRDYDVGAGWTRRLVGPMSDGLVSIEVVVRTRRATWDLHRRTVGESSAVFRTWEDLFPTTGADARHPHLFSVFLSAACRVKMRRPSLGFSVDLGIPVPQYETTDSRGWTTITTAGTSIATRSTWRSRSRTTGRCVAASIPGHPTAPRAAFPAPWRRWATRWPSRSRSARPRARESTRSWSSGCGVDTGQSTALIIGQSRAPAHLFAKDP